jgi:hypothetical protein
MAQSQRFPTWAWAYWSSPITYQDAICDGFLGLFNFEQKCAELIVGVPRKIPTFFKRLGHGDRGNGSLCGQPVKVQPVPNDWTWFPGGDAPQPTEMPTVSNDRPATLLMWTQCALSPRDRRSDGELPQYELLISAWKEVSTPRKVVMIVEKRGDFYVRVGLEHRQFKSYQELEEDTQGQSWQWVAIR